MVKIGDTLETTKGKLRFTDQDGTCTDGTYTLERKNNYSVAVVQVGERQARVSGDAEEVEDLITKVFIELVKRSGGKCEEE